MGDITNLFVGPCILYVDGIDVGFTQGGIRMRVDKSMWGRPSLSGLGIEEVVKQSEDYYISTILPEITLDNLKRAWGINETEAGNRIDFGGSMTVPVHTLKFVAEDDFFTAYFYKVVSVDFGELIFSKTSSSALPTTFRALLDTTKAVGAQIGYISRASSGSKDLVLRLTVPKIKTSNIYARVLVYYIPGTLNLVSRTTVLKESTKSLVGRSTIYKATSRSLLCRTAVTPA